MKETDYDRIMKLGEKVYLRLKKENDPYAFHKAVEMVMNDYTAGSELVNVVREDYEKIDGDGFYTQDMYLQPLSEGVIDALIKYCSPGCDAPTGRTVNPLNHQEGSTPSTPTPYFGWCDVEGCDEESCSGGSVWRETGYWGACTKHAYDYGMGKPQPKMKQSAIKREKSRDKKTGYLK